MAQVRVDPASKNWPYLEAGKYGPGTPNPAECEVMAYECPAEENPRYDAEGKDGPYAYFHVQVRRPDAGIVNIRLHEQIGANTASRVLPWLVNIGVPVADDGTHDDATVPGKRCIVECGEPRQDKNDPNKRYTNLRALLGAG